MLTKEYRTALSGEPRLVRKVTLTFLQERAGTKVVEISAVLVAVGRERTAVMFVDNEAREIYGQLMVDGLDTEKRIDRFMMTFSQAFG